MPKRTKVLTLKERADIENGQWKQQRLASQVGNSSIQAARLLHCLCCTQNYKGLLKRLSPLLCDGWLPRTGKGTTPLCSSPGHVQPRAGSHPTRSPGVPANSSFGPCTALVFPGVWLTVICCARKQPLPRNPSLPYPQSKGLLFPS